MKHFSYKKTYIRAIAAALLTMIISVATVMSVFAASADINISVDNNEADVNGEVKARIVITSEERIDSYAVNIVFDNEKLKYLSGTLAEPGKIILRGAGNTNSVTYVLAFKAIAAGDADLKIEKADIKSAADGSEITVSELGKCSVKINASASEPTTENKEEQTGKTINLIFVIAGAIVAVIIILLIILAVISHIKKKRRKARRDARRKKLEEIQQKRAQTEIVDINEALGYEKKEPEEAPEQLPSAKPVISIKNVSMTFRSSNSNASGIKEYLIQLVKHKIKVREFTALDDISFDVFKGEVVGIIGTNGSGKSTLLKIVSGVLKPTKGKVFVDRRKVQLLTLGTGFDVELTARENVYLNGAIIGYTKQFIDENYDKIVEFAELEDFMDEKVKNFSSGMVSRLGFAIATVGNAAEILILDEVLAVGDEFFRKKSLARVKEMIHGGSTVLLVSHSMGTIRENCSKVVWIEKSKLRMIGDTKEVCDAYQKMNG